MGPVSDRDGHYDIDGVSQTIDLIVIVASEAYPFRKIGSRGQSTLYSAQISIPLS